VFKIDTFNPFWKISTGEQRFKGARKLETKSGVQPT